MTVYSIFSVRFREIRPAEVGRQQSLLLAKAGELAGTVITMGETGEEEGGFAKNRVMVI